VSEVAGGKVIRKTSKLNLVDLAGSERQQADSKTVGKETISINRSLSVLSSVITVLSQKSADGKTTHIPYRDSKLTCLLKDALGGNTKTLMIACVNPTLHNVNETLSTLRYANRAKAIVNEVMVNENSEDKVIRELLEENARLTALLASAPRRAEEWQEAERHSRVMAEQKTEASAQLCKVLAEQNKAMVAVENEVAAQHSKELAEQSQVMGAEVEALRKLMREREVSGQQESAVLQDALREERTLTAHQRETIVVMNEMKVERDGDRYADLLDEAMSANELVVLSRNVKLLDSVLDNHRDEKLRTVLITAWVKEQRCWRDLTRRLADQWKNEDDVDISTLRYLAEQHVERPLVAKIPPYLAETTATREKEEEEKVRNEARLNRLEDLVAVLQDRAVQAQASLQEYQVENSRLNDEVIEARDIIVELKCAIEPLG
jgi:hypothetical protein